jgi:hypothetical protein
VSPVAKKAVAAALLVAGVAGAYVVRSTRHARRPPDGKDIRKASPGESNGAISVTKTSPFPSTQ